jgi:hypothetical protein
MVEPLRIRILVRSAVVASGLLWLGGCVPSLHPLYTEKDRTTESDLLGTWTQGENKDSWEFESGADESYVLTYTEKGAAAKFRTTLVQLGEHLFLDLYPSEDAELKNELLKLHLVPAHSFARLRLKGDTLELAMMDNDWVRGKLARKEISVPHEVLDDGIVLTASTPQLQEFVTSFASDPAAFPKLIVLKRVGQ